MGRFPCIFSVLVLTVFASPALSEIVGEASNIVDGDTFDLCTATECVRIRLCGVNAPERGSVDYAKSKHALSVVLKTGPVHCRMVGDGTPCDGRSKKVSHNRYVAQCFVYTMDVAAYLVSRGMACDWVKFSGGAYGRLPNEFCP